MHTLSRVSSHGLQGAPSSIFAALPSESSGGPLPLLLCSTKMGNECISCSRACESMPLRELTAWPNFCLVPCAVSATMSSAAVPMSRYYARGLFATPAMAAAPGTPTAALAAPLPVLDWPLRNLSGGSLAAGDR